MTSSLGLALDTSVLINLLATEQPWAILGALGRNCMAPEEVVREVRRNPVTQQPYSINKHPLRMAPEFEVVELGAQELELFLGLVGAASPDRLGDGEAAAIAIAVVRRCAIGLDDGKARRIVRERYPETLILMTVDILECDAVRSRLGREGAVEAYAKAKQFGRMHIPRRGAHELSE